MAGRGREELRVKMAGREGGREGEKEGGKENWGVNMVGREGRRYQKSPCQPRTIHSKQALGIHDSHLLNKNILLEVGKLLLWRLTALM